MEVSVKAASVEIDYLAFFKNSSDEEGRGVVQKVSKNQIVFETYNLSLVNQLSEILTEFSIIRGEKQVYEGRAIVADFVNTGVVTIVSATLIDEWKDLKGVVNDDELREETKNFIQAWQNSNNILPDYQYIVNKIRSFYHELHIWLSQEDTANDILDKEEGPKINHAKVVEESLADINFELFNTFEIEAKKVPDDLINNHKAHAQKALHPFMMCAPFVNRTFSKPFGYAGDFLMVNMILGNPLQGDDTYTKIVNSLTLRSPGAEAHRNRIRILTKKLIEMADQAAKDDVYLKVRNMACGPAREVSNFIKASKNAERISFSLIDGDNKALGEARRAIKEAVLETKQVVNVEYMHKSAKQVLIENRRDQDVAHREQYDLVYCAGMFDYFKDRGCKNLLGVFYDWASKGGEVLVTNVHEKNSIRAFMEHLMEWYLEYRDHDQFDALAPDKSKHSVYSDETGFNIFLKIEKI